MNVPPQPRLENPHSQRIEALSAILAADSMNRKRTDFLQNLNLTARSYCNYNLQTLVTLTCSQLSSRHLELVVLKQPHHHHVSTTFRQ
jgi:hypothetical protein